MSPHPPFEPITVADVRRMKRLWRKVVPSAYVRLLDAEWLTNPNLVSKRPIRAHPIEFGEQDDPPGRFRWDEENQRYLRANGSAVRLATLQDLILRVETNLIPRSRATAQQLIDGTISVNEWYSSMRSMVKDGHVLSAALARGGWNQMNWSDWGYTGSMAKRQYKFLDRFAMQLETGQVPLDGRVLVRSQAYMKTAYFSFEEMRRRLAGQLGLYNEETRILGGTDPCDDCLDYAGQGWQPLGTLARLGDSQCVFNCRCSFEFRFNTDQLVVPFPDDFDRG